MMDLELNDLDHVAQLLLNARLRDEIEPYLDESVLMVDTAMLPTSVENDFLAAMLAWERAPITPVSQWFTPELKLVDCSQLSDEEVNTRLHDVVQRLFEKNIVLTCTGHLSDRQLYCLISRNILPSFEKQFLVPGNFLRWQCVDEVHDVDTWLMYYADESDRRAWECENCMLAPPRKSLPYPRTLPTG
ncbi:MAG TPA: hypothetical protein PKD64_02940 [Pirellulaceae bacterium]|nr:hypothetical protein [Pirellulaceae bacterium]HMO91125.1 hypothetical protein [Pirellulaceae bacterium]HMP71065.1 hypothetical protein [Pirellulaceae bacterium]